MSHVDPSLYYKRNLNFGIPERLKRFNFFVFVSAIPSPDALRNALADIINP